MSFTHPPKKQLAIWTLNTVAILMLSHSNGLFAGDRLLATGGVMQIEGSGGGGLTPWALISGYGTDKQIGGSAFYTEARTNGDFEISSGGVSIGLHNRLEISLSQQKLGLSDTVPGESIRVNTMGVKLRLFGDAIYEQDTWLPQVSLGVQIKHNEDFHNVPKALGAKHQTGVDVYLAATKLYLGAVFGRNLLINGTLQATKANQFGFLGFGGDNRDNYQIKPAASVAVMLTDQVLLGTEYRYKPDNLSVFKEENAHDVFLAWFPTKNISLTAAYLDLGNIANKSNQSGWYLSGQIAY
ncbi:MAG: DUF3034 domain-containing protein [Methylotenera sp.]|jgi:hypothetical protein|uniref:DUF3034 family protein n=1 Tax=Methylotenera mobilis TaxID=359408 RepID=UPI0003633027|nr:MAG: DUF3034 domain-containing protein [Methylotenera sp.]PPD45115.1 MAG: DUF3034 domain-containing protein [Methylotenera sp.]